MVSDVSFGDDVTMVFDGYPDATPVHRFGREGWWVRFVPQHFRWWKMRDRGRCIGVRRVVKITVTDAHAYYARHPAPGSAWRLCHNKQVTER
jgi:hypothetical protein